MTEISRFDGVEPYESGDNARDGAAPSFTDGDIEAFAATLSSDTSAEVDLSGHEGDAAIQKHLLAERALNEVATLENVDDLLKDIREKGE